MSTAPATLGWFARHELNLAWREWVAMMTCDEALSCTPASISSRSICRAGDNALSGSSSR